MTKDSDPTTYRTQIVLHRQDGGSWRVYGQTLATFRRIDDMAVAFTIDWLTGIERGHRISDQPKRSWTILAIARMSATEERPSLILTCRRVLEK